MNSNKHSKLSIAILAAKDLTPKDRNKSSDPFCELRLMIRDEKEEPKYKTR
jgi:Ca2+-dependent lipid-binding protein